MTVPGYVPQIGEKDLDKIIRAVRNLYENGGSASDVTNIESRLAPIGQCQLTLSGGSLLLSRHNGKYLFIENTAVEIPSSGPTLANTGLTAATLYYIYAYMSSGTMTLEASTTVPTEDSTYRHKIKTGDSTRSLVGMVYMDSGTPGTFADSVTKRYVRSWFNRDVGELKATLTSYVTSSSTSFVNIGSLMVGFVVWSDEAVIGSASGTTSNNTAASTTYTALGFNGTTPEDPGAGSSTFSGAEGYGFASSCTTSKKGFTEGYNDMRLLGHCDVGTSTWRGSTTTGESFGIIANIIPPPAM